MAGIKRVETTVMKRVTVVDGGQRFADRLVLIRSINKVWLWWRFSPLSIHGKAHLPFTSPQLFRGQGATLHEYLAPIYQGDRI